MNILERCVVAGLAAGKGMSEILKHLPACRTNVDLLGRHLQSLHETQSVVMCLPASGEARQGEAQHIAAGETKAVHSLRRHDQGLR